DGQRTTAPNTPPAPSSLETNPPPAAGSRFPESADTRRTRPSQPRGEPEHPDGQTAGPQSARRFQRRNPSLTSLRTQLARDWFSIPKPRSYPSQTDSVSADRSVQPSRHARARASVPPATREEQQRRK